MKKEKFVVGFELLIMMISIFAFSHILAVPVSAQSATSEPSVCCEKTTEGAFCVNTDEAKCDTNFKSSPTSCESTSYCQLGTCYDSEEGICLENTPQNVCSSNGGSWDKRPIGEVSQCQLGCCIIGDQAAFVPLVRCKRLSSFFGVENDYRTDIKSEVSCIAAAQSQDKGACVYEKDFERTCEFTTRKDCGAGDTVEISNGSKVSLSGERRFYKDFLCSAEELNTACARQTSTTCSEGDVYWLDSCGNKENVYSSNKDKSWNSGKVSVADNVCDPNDGSDTDCGNCDYLLGSRCSEWDGLLNVGKPAGSDYFCQKTECTDRNGDQRLNGESWCVSDDVTGNGYDSVGSRYFKETCVDGGVKVEPCAEYRNEICIEGAIETGVGDFGTAICRVNRWQDCVGQDEEDDCENTAKRDCNWIPSVRGLFLNTNDEQESIEGVCAPNFAPGLKFWEDSSAKQACGIASAECQVVYEKGLLDGGWKIVEGGECLEDDWGQEVNRICSSFGDCGGNVNYVGEYVGEGYDWKIDDEKKTLSETNFVTKRKASATAMILTLILGENFLPFVSGQAESAAGIISYSPGSVLGAGTTVTAGTVNVGGNAYVIGNTLQGTTEVLTSVKITSSGAYAQTATGQSFLGVEATAGAGVTSGSATTISPLSSLFGASGSTFGNAILNAFFWAAIAFVAGYALGQLFGLSDKNSLALGAGASSGTFVGQFISTFWGAGLGTAIPIGAVIGAIVFVALYKDQKITTVKFSCLPWQAPTGGDNCEKCNDDELGCSEYQCKSLGQTCEIVNKGSDQERCVDINPNDANPPVITPNTDLLTENHEYTNVKSSPPSPGMEIVDKNSVDGCLKSYTELQFGINVNEPAQCRIDYNHTTKFEDMAVFMEDNLYKYNHTVKFSLPSNKDIKNSPLILENGKDMTWFIRCKDQSKNENSAEYAVRFCVDPSPDLKVPEIRATSILNGGCVSENQNSANVDFYTNEPADCKWGPNDQSYDLMPNEMDCSYQQNANRLYTCKTNLAGISRDVTNFFVKCKDNPSAEENDRNTMTESFDFSLRGSTGLKMKNLRPNETVFGGVSPTPVELYVETLFGCNTGKAVCSYSDEKDRNYIRFFDTDNADGIHTQRLDLASGNHEYFVKCIDAGGNLVEDSVRFNVDIDTNAPVIARIYQEESMLKIVTVRDSQCSYTLNSCDFTIAEGTDMPYANSTIHVTEWNKENTYYIKCRDQFRNENADCSAIVKPSSNFL